MDRLISEQAIINILMDNDLDHIQIKDGTELIQLVQAIPSAYNYEYHTDHTDCIWYGSNRGCPVTCSQYRDGWNDAMDYIYKGGKGYQPYTRE